MDSEKYTFVTVVYEGDLVFVFIQARSISKYVSRHLIHKIIVIDNFTSETDSAWRGRLLKEYGQLADLVDFVLAGSIVAAPSMDGWWVQQVLKLEISKLVETTTYIVLDGKHHLVSQLLESFLRTSDGRLRIRSASYLAHPFLSRLKKILGYFSIGQAKYLERFPTTTPPWTMIVSEIRDLIDYVHKREKTSLADFMVNHQFMEFFLYSCYLISQGKLERCYELNEVAYPVVWPFDHEVKAVKKVIDSSMASESPFFAVHRSAVGMMKDDVLTEIAGFWHERGLFEELSSALLVLGEIRREQIENGNKGKLARLLERLRKWRQLF